MKLRIALSIALGLSVIVVPSTQNARAAAVWGATEWTQIANNIELVLQYKEMVEQTITQVRQYETQLKTLRQMDSNKLEGMLKGVGGVRAGTEVLQALADSQEVHDRLASLNANMDLLASQGRDAMSVAEHLRSKGHNVNPRDYVGMIRALSREQNSVYARRLETIDKAASAAQSDIERVNQIAKMAPEIETHVEGFGALIQTNAIMSSQLGGLRESMSTAAAMSTETARMLSEETANAKEERQMRKDFLESAILAPGVGQ